MCARSAAAKPGRELLGTALRTDPGGPEGIEGATSAESLPARTEKDRAREASRGLSICRREAGSQEPPWGLGKELQVQPQPRGRGGGGEWNLEAEDNSEVPAPNCPCSLNPKVARTADSIPFPSLLSLWKGTVRAGHTHHCAWEAGHLFSKCPKERHLPHAMGLTQTWLTLFDGGAGGLGLWLH